MNHTNLLSVRLDQLPTQGTLSFEYGVLEAEKRKVVQQYTNEIKGAMRRSSQDIIDIGHKLTEVKQHLGHGSFRNWLKFEFNWSVSAATKFMQVWEQFKCVNFTHLNITASTLYLIAAPSTPKQARVEVLERASNGENIGYAKAKKIVCQYRKTKQGVIDPKTPLLNPDEPVSVIEPIHSQTSAISTQEDSTHKVAQTEMRCPNVLPRASPDLPCSMVFKNNQIATNIFNIPDETTQTPISIENLAVISQKTPDAVVAQIAISITNLTSEQLAEVIIKAADNGLSKYHLSTIIMASQQALMAFS